MPRLNYERINWEDAPSTETPLSAENLNIMDNAIAALFSYLGELEQRVDNLSMQDASNMTATFGEPGEEGGDEAPLQPSGSSIGNIVTGIHSRIRALQNDAITTADVNTAVNAAVDDASKNLANNIAEAFDASKSYSVGDYCSRQTGKYPVIFRCIAASTGDWNSSNWEEVKIGDEISRAKGDVTEWNTCALTGTYLTGSTIQYCIQGKLMFFCATIKPNQAIQSAAGEGEIADNIGTFAQAIAYPVTRGTIVGVQNLEAWSLYGTKSFRIAGAMTANTNYYFGGIAILN